VVLGRKSVSGSHSRRSSAIAGLTVTARMGFGEGSHPPPPRAPLGVKAVFCRISVVVLAWLQYWAWKLQEGVLDSATQPLA